MSQSLNGEFARQDDDGNPRSEPSHGGELDGSRHDHEFIGEWIEEFSSDGNEVEFSCEVSVEEIGEGGDRKQAIERCFHSQAYDDKRNENDAYHRDGIGDVEEVAFNRRTEFWSCFFLCRIFSDPKGAESSRSLILLKIHRIDFRF